MKRLMKIIKSQTLFACLILTVLALPNIAKADIDIDGDVDPNDVGGSDPWIIPGDLIIGDTEDANLIVDDGSAITNIIGYIGYDVNSTGTVYIDDRNSLWTNTGGLYIGGTNLAAGGTGFLNISDEAIVDANGVIIWSTGTLSGNATLISGMTRNYGTISPGNSGGETGILTIDGDVRFEPNSTLEVEIENIGRSDKLVVTGDVDIAGGTVKVVSIDTIIGWKEYTIVEANSVTGTFDAVNTALLETEIVNPYAGLNYTTDSVLLKIAATNFDNPSVAVTENQKAVARVLQWIADSGGNTITTGLQNLDNIGQVRGALDQLSGQSRPSIAPVTVADASKFMGTISDRMLNASPSLSNSYAGGPMFAMAGPGNSFGSSSLFEKVAGGNQFSVGNGSKYFADRRWGFWGKGYGIIGNRDTESGAPGYDYSIYGTSLGVDYRYTDNFLLGITGGFSSGEVEYSKVSDSTDISGRHIGIYDSYFTSDWCFDSIMAISQLEYDTKRNISLTGESLSGSFDGFGVSGYFEARYDYRSNVSWFIQPLASLQFTYLNLDSYKETGGVSALGYDEQDYTSYKGSIGFRARRNIFMKDDDSRYGTVEIRGRWLHEFGDAETNVDTYFANIPNAVFTVTDDEISRNSLVLGVGLSAKPNYRTRLLFDYDLSLNADDTAHLFTLAVEYRK